MKDIHSNMNFAVVIDPAVYSADTTPVVIDLKGINAAELILAIGVGGISFNGTNKIEFVLTHSDDGTTYTNVTDADLRGVSGVSNGIIKSLTAAKAAADVTKIGYVGGKKWLKLLADFSGTHGTGTPIDAILIKGNPRFTP